MPSAREHKSLDKYPARLPLVWIDQRSGHRDLTMEGSVWQEDGRYCYRDKDALVTLHLNAEALEFLCDVLPYSDGFTDVIEYLRDLAKHDVEAAAWAVKARR